MTSRTIERVGPALGDARRTTWITALQVAGVLSIVAVMFSPEAHRWPWGAALSTLFVTLLLITGGLGPIPSLPGIVTLLVTGLMGVGIAGGRLVAWQGFEFLLASLTLTWIAASWQASPWALVWGIGLCASGLALALPWINLTAHQELPVGPLLLQQPINKNIAVSLIAPAIPLLIVLAGQARRWLRWLTWSLAAANLGLVVLMGARGALLGLVVMVAGWWLLGWPAVCKEWSWLPLLATLVLGVAGIGVLALSPRYINFGFDRLDLWLRAFWLIAKHPLTGIGFAQFPQAASSLWPYPQGSNGLPPVHAHNLYLQVALDLGIAGLIAYLSLFAQAAWNACRAVSLNSEQRALGLAVVGMLAVIAGHGLVDATAWSLPSALLAGLAFGLAFRLTPGMANYDTT